MADFPPIHLGEVLREDFFKRRGLRPYAQRAAARPLFRDIG